MMWQSLIPFLLLCICSISPNKTTKQNVYVLPALFWGGPRLLLRPRHVRLLGSYASFRRQYIPPVGPIAR